MIVVPWMLCDEDLRTVAAGNVKEGAVIALMQTLGHQPWVRFLFEHHTKIDVDACYEPASMLHKVDVIFHLPPEEETMYRLRFS